VINHALQAKENTVENLRATTRDQEALIQMLDAALLAAGLPARPVPGPWMLALTPQQRGLIGALYGAYPRSLKIEELLDLLPCPRGRDPLDRQSNIVGVIVSKTRSIFGRDCILNDRGIGFRLSEEFYQSIPKKELDKAA
jgi:hypothetical protein